MKRKVKFFAAGNLAELETKVNKWLCGIDSPAIIKIHPYDSADQYCCMVEYEEPGEILQPSITRDLLQRIDSL